MRQRARPTNARVQVEAQPEGRQVRSAQVCVNNGAAPESALPKWPQAMCGEDRRTGKRSRCPMCGEWLQMKITGRRRRREVAEKRAAGIGTRKPARHKMRCSGDVK